MPWYLCTNGGQQLDRNNDNLRIFLDLFRPKPSQFTREETTALLNNDLISKCTLIKF